MIHSNAHDALVERGRSWTRDGVEIRNYADGRNRITARVGSDGVGLARTLGVVCPGLEVTLAELAQLVVFLKWWEEHRTRWADSIGPAPATRPATACRPSTNRRARSRAQSWRAR